MKITLTHSHTHTYIHHTYTDVDHVHQTHAFQLLTNTLQVANMAGHRRNTPLHMGMRSHRLSILRTANNRIESKRNDT